MWENRSSHEADTHIEAGVELSAKKKRSFTNSDHFCRGLTACAAAPGCNPKPEPVLDFKKRTLFIDEKFYPGDNIENDMKSLISYFRKFEGKHKKEIPDFK